MTVEDVPLGRRLNDQAGWNQTEADWHRFLELQPDGCFVAELSGRPVGTTTTCIFGSIAWVAMVLVDKEARGRGIGTRLMGHALAYLDRCGVRSVRLDATPLGRPIYEKLGFVAEYELARWEGVPSGAALSAGGVPASADRLDAVCALDRRATGTDRRRLIDRLCRHQAGAMQVFTAGEKVLAYLTVRCGSRATQIGPAVALTEEAGRALSDAAMQRFAGGRVFVDVPVANEAATGWARSGGLAVQRYFTRMCRGQAVEDQPAMIWASSGPEKG